jgi:antitoxin component HigA of HigAB toxin-antitoxin module
MISMTLKCILKRRIKLTENKDLYKNRELGMDYNDAIELVKENPLLFEDLPERFKTPELKKIANTITAAKAYDYYEYYINNPDKFMEVKENMKNKMTKFGANLEKNSVDNKDMDGYIKHLKDNNRLDELKEKIKEIENLDDTV